MGIFRASGARGGRTFCGISGSGTRPRYLLAAGAQEVSVCAIFQKDSVGARGGRKFCGFSGLSPGSVRPCAGGGAGPGGGGPYTALIFSGLRVP